MELAGFEDLIAQADRIAHYDDQAKRDCLHELISRQLILNRRFVFFLFKRQVVFPAVQPKMQKYANSVLCYFLYLRGC